MRADAQPYGDMLLEVAQVVLACADEAAQYWAGRQPWPVLGPVRSRGAAGLFRSRCESVLAKRLNASAEAEDVRAAELPYDLLHASGNLPSA